MARRANMPARSNWPAAAPPGRRLAKSFSEPVRTAPTSAMRIVCVPVSAGTEVGERDDTHQFTGFTTGAEEHTTFRRMYHVMIEF